MLQWVIIATKMKNKYINRAEQFTDKIVHVKHMKTDHF